MADGRCDDSRTPILRLALFRLRRKIILLLCVLQEPMMWNGVSHKLRELLKKK